MEYRRCQPPCVRFIAREDPHSKCIKCLGFSHARDAVYGTSKCKICDDFRLITLRSRLEDCERESSIFPWRTSSTSAAPREIAASREAATWGSDVELEEMESEQTGLAFSLPPSPGHVRANSPVEFLHDFLFPSPGARDTVSFGLDDILHTAASDFGPALADALPPSGQEARPSAAYSELVDVLSRATEKLALDWPDEPCESQASKLDERFLIGAHSKPERRKLQFFSDLHREISSSWKQPFSSRLTNAAAADFTNLVGSVEQGYTAMPVIEDTLASHLSPSLAPSWKSRPLLPSKPCRTTSALIGKSYIAAGQAGMALHTMAILQAYQADVLKEMDEGTGLTPEAVKELRRGKKLTPGSSSQGYQGYRSRPHQFSWPQDERQEECAPPISANRVSGGSFGFRSDAGRLAPARIPDLTACLAHFKLGHHVSVGTCRRLLGLMAAASPVLPLGLLHMRPFLWWMKELRLHPTVPATHLIRVSRSCCRPLLMWRDPVFLRSGVRMGAIHRRYMITMDASMTGWGAVSGVESGRKSSSLGI